MSASLRTTTAGARLGCEPLEDRAVPAAALALVGTNLVAFDTATPDEGTSTAITGIGDGEALVGLDFRAADGRLYALGVNAAADTATLYTIALDTGAAMAAGTAGGVRFVDAAGAAVDLPDPAAAGYAVSFDPGSDTLRVVTGGGLNFRVRPSGSPIDGDTGLAGQLAGVNPDGILNGLPDGSVGVTGVAHAPAAGPGTPALLYALDPDSDGLYTQAPGASGTLGPKLGVTLDGAPLDFTAVRGFDIPEAMAVAEPGDDDAGDDAENGDDGGEVVTAPLKGVATLVVGGATRVYEIDLTTGVATELGGAPDGATGVILTDAPAPTVAFTAAAFETTEAGKKAEVTLTRTGDLSAELTVSVVVDGGTATAGEDFTGTSYTVTFAAGSATAALVIDVADDGEAEDDETIVLTLSEPSAGVLGEVATATVTVADSGEAPPPEPVPPFVAIGSGIGAGVVGILNPDGSPRAGFRPYGDDMVMGVRVALADVTGDGVDDIVTAPGLHSSHVKVFDGRTMQEVMSFLAFDASYLGAVSVAAGDVNGDGKADVFVGSAQGSSHAKVFDAATGDLVVSFYTGEVWANGVNVAAGDVTGDGKADLIVGSAGRNTEVKVFDLKTRKTVHQFFAVRGFPGGVDVAAADVTGDGRADLIVGTAQGSSAVRVFDGRTAAEVRTHMLLPPSFLGGVSVGARDVTGDGIPDVLAGAASGTDLTKYYDGATGAELGAFSAFRIGFAGGVFMA